MQVLHRLSKFWFAEATPMRLAILRVMVGSYALLYLLTRQAMMIRIAGSNDSLYDPVGVVAGLTTPLPVPVFECILSLTILANIAFIFGWGFRVSGPVFAGLLLTVLCYRNSWSMVYHSDNLLVFHVLILGFTRSADSLSLDWAVRCWWNKWRTRSADRSNAGDSSWKYGWPLQLICTVTALTYFLAGIAKVAGPLGWSWAGGESLRSQVAADLLRKDLLAGQTSMLAPVLYDHVWLFTILGVGTLALELAALIVIFNKPVARKWIFAMFALHWGIYFLMGIKFRYQLTGIAFASFLLRDFYSSTSPASSRRCRDKSVFPPVVRDATPDLTTCPS